jgi:hypothetical protein
MTRLLLALAIVSATLATVCHQREASAEIISIKTQGELTATTTSQQVVGANMRRKYLLVQNKGSQDVYLKFETAPTGTQGILIPRGGNYESIDMPISPAFIKTNAGTSAVFWMEGQ